jgi:8-amino-7-oxononanoate synthase
MGTLSKALGSLGGYIAGSASLIDFLRNRAPSWIYTTGLSPGDTAAALEAIAIIRAEPERRQKLWQNIAYLQQEFATKLPSCWKILPSQSPIFALQMADAAAVLAAGRELKAAGIWAAAVRPPTVPTSRIRITVMATHELEHCQFLVNVLSQFESI